MLRHIEHACFEHSAPAPQLATAAFGLGGCMIQNTVEPVAPIEGRTMSGLQTNGDPAGSSRVALESRATRFAVVTFVLTGVATIFVFHGTHAPLAGEGSVGALAAWAAGGLAAIAFAASFIIEVRRGHASWR